MTCNNSKQYQKSDIGSTYYVQILKGTNEGCPVIFWQSHHFWHWLSLSNQLLNDNIIGQTPVRLFSLFFPFRLKLIFKGRIEKTCVQIKKIQLWSVNALHGLCQRWWNTGPLFGLFISALPLYFTISDIVYCNRRKKNYSLGPDLYEIS